MEPSDGLLPDPGQIAVDQSGGSLPQDSSDSFVQNLPSIDPQALLTVDPTDDSSVFTDPNAGDLGTVSGLSNPYYSSGSVSDLAGSAPSTGVDYSAGLGDLVNVGASLLNGLVVAPAVASANANAQKQNIANELTLLSGQQSITTASITTILIWGAIAWGIVTLFQGASRKV